jgi:peptidoglycan L-alanyl-D-glutamate endopeptidase CwlK
MKLNLIRNITSFEKDRNGNYTLGSLRSGDNEIVATLEPAWADNKVNLSAIPTGTYTCKRARNSKGVEAYVINSVLGRSGIWLTVGNTSKDTRGSILLGTEYGYINNDRAVMNSRRALEKLMDFTKGVDFELTVSYNQEAEVDICDKNNGVAEEFTITNKVVTDNFVMPEGCGISVNDKLLPQRRGIDVLHPKTKEKVQKFLTECGKQGLRVLVLETLRTVEEQNRLFSQGRNGNPGNIVTNAQGLNSTHIWGCAFDVCQNIRGREWEEAFFPQVGKIGEQCGLEWGGSWKSFRDMPHFQDRDLITGTSPQSLINKYNTFEEFRKTW